MTQQFIEICNRISKKIIEYTGDNMVREGIIDSLDVMNLIVELEDEFEIEFDPEDVIPENFGSAHTIWELVKKANG